MPFSFQGPLHIPGIGSMHGLLFEEKAQARGREDPGTGPMSLRVHRPPVR